MSSPEVSQQAPVTIRWAISTEYPEIAKVEKRCFGEALPQEDWKGEKGKKYITTRRIAVIKNPESGQEQIVASILYRFGQNRVVKKYNGYTRIIGVAVLPKYRRRGIGSQLVNAIVPKQQFPRHPDAPIRHHRLWTIIHNPPDHVIAFFEKNGLKTTRCSKTGYVVMELMAEYGY